MRSLEIKVRRKQFEQAGGIIAASAKYPKYFFDRGRNSLLDAIFERKKTAF
jgi:hypothetical protein